MVVAKSVWSYQLGDAYVPMPDQASDGLEELYMQWEMKHAPGQHEVSSGKYKYAVDFGEMTQKNLETGKRRKLQRSQSQCWAQLAAHEAEKQDLLSQLGALQARVLQLESAEEDLRNQTQSITSEKQQLSEANQRLTLANQSLAEEKKRFAEESERLTAENVRLSDKVSATVEEMQQLKHEKAAAEGQLHQQTKKQEHIIKNYYANQILEDWHQCQTASYGAAVRAGASPDELRRSIDQVLQDGWSMQSRLQGLSLRLVSILGCKTIDTDATTDLSIPRESGDFLLLEHMFLKSVVRHRRDYHSEEWCDSPQLEVISIAFVNVPDDLPKKYEALCQEMEQLGSTHRRTLFRSSKVWRPLLPTRFSQEVFMFHGAPWRAVDSISASGFKLELSGTHRGSMFGEGIYFAPHASKSDFYSDCNEKGEKCMFLCRVALGYSRAAWGACQDMSPTDNPDLRWESVWAVTKDCGGVVDHPEACIYSEDAALPCVKIIYKHRPACRCHLCQS